MFQHWKNEASNRKPNILYSVSDRSDFWPVRVRGEALGNPDSDGGLTGSGMIAGTLVATEMGWMAVQDLRPGDRVVTFDNGMVPLREVRASRLNTHAGHLPRAFWPLRLPERALGNRQEMLLLPEQSVLVESDHAETLYGDPFVLVGAAALEGYNGIERVMPGIQLKVLSLRFNEDQVVYANGMVLLQCSHDEAWIARSPEDLMELGRNSRYLSLPRAQGKQLIGAMRQAEAGGAPKVSASGR